MLSWHDSAKKTGGVKAKEDTDHILLNLGFKKIDSPKNKLGKLFFVFLLYPIILKIKHPDNIVIQFPSGTPALMNHLLKSTKKSATKLILLIHDIESLRINSIYSSDYNKETVQTELDMLQSADRLIVLNDIMKKWLTQQGIKTPMVSLYIWDYLSTAPLNILKTFDKSICFAGNLDKSTFLTTLNIKHGIDVYGPNPQNFYPNCVKYHGAYSPEKLNTLLTQNFGLVWDGNSCETCSGKFGEYIRYNNPHKLSLYLSNGIPVIFWKHGALAPFIKKYNVGILIEDLSEIDSLLENLSTEEYQTIKNNALVLSEKLRSGYFLESALKKLDII